MSKPFYFYTRVHLPELTGLKARNITELVHHLKTVPGSVIYHHTHHFLEQHQYLSPEPPNDFAYWVSSALNDPKLAEKLSSINTCDFSTIRALREKIIETIERHLKGSKTALKEVDEGREFYFIKSISFIFPTKQTASTLEEFAAILEQVSINTIYFHMFEAKLRLEKETNDFSLWLETELKEKELVRKISKLDPYTHTMEGLRKKIIGFIRNSMAKNEKGVS